jgi:hypothetical protein
MATPGTYGSSALTNVTDGAKLLNKTARAYNAMRKAHPAIHLAGQYAGYRSAAVQHGMHIAGSAFGTAAQRAKYNLNPHSSVSIADHPNGTHEHGDRVDLVGLPIDQLVSIARQFGFTREFGAADPNHFKHDGVTATSTPKPANARPGKIEYTINTGKPNKTYYQNLQWYARVKGGYDGPIDGKLGVQSYKGLQAALKHEGVYNGPIDGKYDPALKKALQTYAKRYGGYDGPLDGKLGPNSYIGISKALNRI